MSDPQPPLKLRIATRSSRLALWQAEHVKMLLKQARPDCDVELLHVTTTGDSNQTSELRAFGGQGVFTREVQKAVLDARADLAVHSLKDLPTLPTVGLVLSGVPARAETADALVLPQGITEPCDPLQLPHAARIGTGSPRRQAQLWHRRPDFQLSEVRGNVETRLRKLDSGEYDALILAAAGLNRLGLGDRVSCHLEPPLMFPAVGQGALGIECREGDSVVIGLLESISDSTVKSRVTAERALLAQLKAGCHAPVGTASRIENGELVLDGVVLSVDGKERLFASCRGSVAQPAELGIQLAELLLTQGADRLIQ